MHFAVLVITEERPTKEVLSSTLAQFGPHQQGHWDWWTLGGRYTGNLIPVDRENTMTGGPNLPEFERMLAETGMGVVRPGRSGPGVDALQYGNLASLHNGCLPHVVIFWGEWHECEVISLQALARGAGLQVTLATEELEAEHAAMARWSAKFDSIMEQVSVEHWISVVDCHS